MISENEISVHEVYGLDDGWEEDEEDEDDEEFWEDEWYDDEESEDMGGSDSYPPSPYLSFPRSYES